MTTKAKGPSTVDELLEEVDTLHKILSAALTACSAAAWWQGIPGEGAAEQFERVAEAFHRDTGFVRPGKDSSAAAAQDEAKRNVAWVAWVAAKQQVIATKLKVAFDSGGFDPADIAEPF